MTKIMLAAILMLASTASAQTFDPDPSDPGAHEVAAVRYQLSWLGLMPPPVGWLCWQSVPDVNGPLYVECEPDPALLEQQQREQERWLEYRRALLDALRRHRGR